MRQSVVTGVLAAVLTVFTAAVSAQSGTSLATVNLPQAVMADGQRLAAGSYQVRLTTDRPAPVAGQSPESAQYVEFVSGGKVVGRAAATVIPQAEIAQVAKGPRPGTNSARVDLLKGGDYLRVWINRTGQNYLIHLPPAESARS
jgi:hypothetical protein